MDGAKLFGGGGGKRGAQSINVGLANPNGSGGSVGYNHVSGLGTTVSAEAKVPVWTNTSKYGESTLNVGAGTTHHFGGPGGSRNLNKSVGLNFTHRF